MTMQHPDHRGPAPQRDDHDDNDGSVWATGTVVVLGIAVLGWLVVALP